MQQTTERDEVRVDPKVQVMYYLPYSIRVWLSDEAQRRNTSASALITELVQAAQREQEAA